VALIRIPQPGQASVQAKECVLDDILRAGPVADQQQRDPDQCHGAGFEQVADEVAGHRQAGRRPGERRPVLVIGHYERRACPVGHIAKTTRDAKC
jgi:hypothetical protein